MTQKQYRKISLTAAKNANLNKKSSEDFSDALRREFRSEARRNGFTDLQVDRALERYAS